MVLLPFTIDYLSSSVSQPLEHVQLPVREARTNGTEEIPVKKRKEEKKESKKEINKQKIKEGNQIFFVHHRLY